MKRVLVFFPHNFWPPRTGAHKRCRELILALREFDCEITVASSKLSTDKPWTEGSISDLLKAGIANVFVHEPSASDLRFIHRLRNFYEPNYLWLPVVRRLYPSGHREIPFNSRIHTPPGMREWFERVVYDNAPDVIVMNYAYWDRLIDHRRWKSVVRIIDILDIVSLNQRMQKAIRTLLPNPLVLDAVPDSVLQENFFETLHLSASPEEQRVYDRYDFTLAITAKELEIIAAGARNTKVELIPVMEEPQYINNRYSEAALFPVGPNLFNTQGYLYFAKKVLPQVLKEVPSFSLRITGAYNNVIPSEPVSGVRLSGFVPDLKPVFEGTRFLICPVFGGTGQQIKIVEAMAHGVPVVALRDSAERSPLQHGISGLVANNADEFGDYTIRLWNDADLCRKLGDAARETIAREFSRTRLAERLSQMNIF